MRLVIYVLLLLSRLSLSGQEAPALKDIIVDSTAVLPTYKYRAVGLSYQTTRDRALSPLVFTGAGITYTTSTWKYRNSWLWQSDFISQLFYQENEAGTSTLTTSGLQYRYSALHELSSLQKGSWRFWVGPEATVLLNSRLHSRNVNNIASYDWATSLGGSAMVSNQFRLFNRTFAISNQFHFPLLFVYARPAYAWGIPPGLYEEEGSWTDAFKVGTLNSIFSFNNQINLDFFLKKRRKGKVVLYKAYRLAYTWNYFQIETPNKLQTGGHQLSFTRVLYF